jgi:hypothetical protein
MRAYVLIFTSGILFFIIAVVTVLHLMSARALNQQYRMNQSYQSILDALSIQSFVSYFVDKNSAFIALPPILANEYSLSNQVNSDGSVDFFVDHSLTNRHVSFNVQKQITQSSRSSVDLTQFSVGNQSLTGVIVSATLPTHLVALRTVWYPHHASQTLTHYGFVGDNDEEFVTVNASVADEYLLSSPRSSTTHHMNLYFSSLPDGGAISIYLRYSDGSIQNAHIEY